MTRGRCAAGGLLLAVALLGCGHEDDARSDPGAATGEAPLPATLTAYVDQSRVDRVGRNVFVRLVNTADTPVTVTRAVIDSDRFDEVVWTGDPDDPGPQEVVNEGDLDFELPTARCGRGSDARVELTYRVGDGPEVVSTTTATDRYGAIGLFLVRDCALETMTAAADVVIGPQRVVGTGRTSYFELPVDITATGARDDVSFAGFEGTVLFRPIAPTPVYGEAAAVPLVAGASDGVVVRLVPTRCDPHALAEDKVGTLIGVHVAGRDLPDAASYFLPISDEARADLRGFFSTYCGL